MSIVKPCIFLHEPGFKTSNQNLIALSPMGVTVSNGCFATSAALALPTVLMRRSTWSVIDYGKINCWIDPKRVFKSFVIDRRPRTWSLSLSAWSKFLTMEGMF
jgi:hypothetical protein